MPVDGATDGVELPPVPRVSVDRVLGLKRKIQRNPAIIELLDEILTVDRLKDLHTVILAVLPGLDSVAVWQTLLVHIKEPLSEQLLAMLAWRIAGNGHHLAAGDVVLPWSRLAADEWMAFQVIGADPVMLKKKSASGQWSSKAQPHVRLKLKCLVGRFCPGEFHHVWSLPFAKFLAYRLGFDKPWNRAKYHLVDVRQLFGLRFWGMAEAARSGDHPRYQHVEIPGAMRTSNRKLLKSRARDGSDSFQCPKNLPTSVGCHVCPAGIDECPVATHRETYLFGPCNACHRRDAVFAGSYLNPCCVDCQVALETKARKPPR